MKIAVTKHAVDRFIERVEGADGFHPESIREQIRRLVDDGFKLGVVRDHPLARDRRVIPFMSGESVLFLSIGPNTTDFDADVAVIGVLYEKEVTGGKIGMGVQLGDLYPHLRDGQMVERSPRYLMFIGPVQATVEHYYANSEEEISRIIRSRKPKQEEVSIYQLIV
jgi:hypothetical protein